MAVSRLQFVSCGLVSGRLLWQRTYPALIRGRGIVEVEIFRVGDPGVWRDLDLYEGFEPINPAASLFIRRQVLLLNPRARVWVYFLNPQIPRGFRRETQRKFHHKDTKDTKVRIQGVLNVSSLNELQAWSQGPVHCTRDHATPTPHISQSNTTFGFKPSCPLCPWLT